MRQLNMAALALAAGLAGGLLSHYLRPPSVEAQSRAPNEFRAQRFVLEDANGKTLGIVSVEPPGQAPMRGAARGTIRLFDGSGREIWRNPVMGIVPLKD